MVSGLLWRGAPRPVLDLARAGSLTIFTSPELLAELANVLGREKFSARLALAETNADELVYGYAALAKTIRPVRIKPVIKADPDDDKVLACAKAAKAEIIASGDNHLLDLKEYEGIRILTVNQILEEVQ